MCYTKPAPRCSKHAREALKAAKQSYLAASERLEEAKTGLEQAASSESLAKLQAEKERAAAAVKKAKAVYTAKAEEKKQAYNKYKVAQKDYSLTPAGIKQVRASGDEQRADRLASKRASLITASKAAPTKKKDKSVEPAAPKGFKEILKEHAAAQKDTPPLPPERVAYDKASHLRRETRHERTMSHHRAQENPTKENIAAFRAAEAAALPAQIAYEKEVERWNEYKKKNVTK